MLGLPPTPEELWLVEACTFSSASCALSAIEHGASVNCRVVEKVEFPPVDPSAPPKVTTPLGAAIQGAQSYAMGNALVTYLITLGADVHGEDVMATAVGLAEGGADTLQLVIDAGGDVNAATGSDRRPPILHAAAPQVRCRTQQPLTMAREKVIVLLAHPALRLDEDIVRHTVEFGLPGVGELVRDEVRWMTSEPPFVDLACRHWHRSVSTSGSNPLLLPCPCSLVFYCCLLLLLTRT